MVYGPEESGGVRALVMELVEGPTQSCCSSWRPASAWLPTLAGPWEVRLKADTTPNSSQLSAISSQPSAKLSDLISCQLSAVGYQLELPALTRADRPDV